MAVSINTGEPKGKANKVAKAAEEARAKVAKESAEARAKAQGTVDVAAEDVKIENLGVLSDKIAYLGVIVDPTKDDVKGEDKVGKVVVGYYFQALTDMEVPAIGYGRDVKENHTRSFNLDNFKKGVSQKVKAGEEFYLTHFETAVLLTRVEFNSSVTGRTEDGRGIDVTLVAQSRKGKDKDGLEAKVVIPSTYLRASQREETVYINPINAFDATESKNESGQKRYARKPKEGPFMKWTPFTVRSTGSRSNTAGKTSASTAQRNPQAATFQQLLKSL